MTLIRELIHIPERVHQGDFVLKLSEGVREAEATLANYVVTPQLERCFDSALSFIQSALTSHSSKAAYLHGSFGAGKSHFMAVLNLLLAGNPKARSIKALAGTVAKHNGWTEGKRFLLAPYHMIGARTMESAILGGYAERVRELHPEAPVPGFYLAEGLFADAQQLRAQMGDEAFFGKLNEGLTASGWGALDEGWDAASFEAAMLEPPQGEERSRLVGHLIRQFFRSYGAVAEAKGEAFVPLDQGLSILSRHARDLGYDAVILFLDELILWLASRAADLAFVSSEGSKLSKLVEAAHADRPIPLVSFVARQRDLRELVGENMAGAVQLQFADVLKYWEARFHRINLEDRNLPVIAQHRVLRPVSEAAREALDAAFEEFLNRNRGVADTLLTSTADRAIFRQVYPFSPALVETLIAVSSVLQRERTALKLMLQLLVDRREDLELGQLIPVGDLYDAIAEGDEPFSDAMRLHFENAKRLYRQKLLPLLERNHGVTWEAVRGGAADPVKGRALRNDARLIKTLLLAALTPEVESLKGLTAARLAALNHGSVRSPIPGREVQDVLRRCRDWAVEVGEIKITEEQSPVISIQVTGVDIEPIVAAAGSHDNPGNRRRKVRDMLFAALEIEDRNELFTTFHYRWRNTPREVEVIYDNVREMADERLRGREGSWTLVFDFPFDEPNRTPADDLARLARYDGGPCHTLVWLPSFFSDKALKELGRLVVLDYILTGERFNDYATHLSQVDRAQARSLARNQRDQLHQKLRQSLEVAYGIAKEPRDAVANPLPPSDQFHALDGTFSPRPPVGANLGDAFRDLLNQFFAHVFPAHPEFENEVKTGVLKKLEMEVQRALQEKEQRVFVADKSVRQFARAILNPLRLATMADTHLLLDTHWRSHFLKKQAEAGGGVMTVAMLRRWIDQPRPMGLPAEVQNLIIHTFAGQTNRSFQRGAAPYPATLENTPDELELREQQLPDEETWRRAVHRAGLFFGLTLPETLNAANLAKLRDDVLAQATARAAPVQAYCRMLERNWRELGGGEAGADRLTTARSAQALLEALRAPGAELIEVLADTPVATTETAMSHTLGKAAALDGAMKGVDWELFGAVFRLDDQRRAAAEAMRRRVVEVLAADEHVIALHGALAEQKAKALQLLTAPPPVAPQPTPTPEQPPVRKGEMVVKEATRSGLGAGDARRVLDEIGRELDQDEAYRLSITWKITK